MKATALSLLVLFTFAASANTLNRDPGASAGLSTPSPLNPALQGFEENKGQVVDHAGSPANDVRFTLASDGTQIFLLDRGIAYQFERWHIPEEDRTDDHPIDPVSSPRLLSMENAQRETYRMDMYFQGASTSARISTEGESLDHTNYYNREVMNVHRYQKITYHDIYPGIDWVVRATASGFKYDLVLHPGADPDVIRMRFSEHEELRVDENGRLIHGNRLGHSTEERPVSLQNGKEIETEFVLEDDVVHFEIAPYDNSIPLIIDPDRIWGTYYGGTSSDRGVVTTTDADGNIYLAGQTYSSTMIAEAGHQLTHGGNWDAFLVKFDADGVRQWATYYGGPQEEDLLGLTTDASSNVYMAGRTRSTSGIFFEGHQETYGGGEAGDAFLVKFNSAGERLWGTYYGGSGSDIFWSCVVQGDALFAGGTTSSTTHIAVNGYIDQSNGPGCLVKFDLNGVRQWGTYLQGTIYSIALDAVGNIYSTGSMGSFAADNFNMAGQHQDQHGGGWTDAYLMKFNPNGARLWATYYGGENDEHARACTVDPNGDIYIAGVTDSPDNIAYLGHQQTLHGSSDDGFLAKFDPAGERLWGTYLGGENVDVFTSICATADARVIATGWTLSAAGIAYDAIQPQLGGQRDGYAAAFDASGTLLWSTYIGGTGEDQVNGCAIGGADHLLLAGQASSTSGIAHDGHSNTLAGSSDAFLLKWDLDQQLDRRLDISLHATAVPDSFELRVVSTGAPFTGFPSARIPIRWETSAGGELETSDIQAACSSFDLTTSGTTTIGPHSYVTIILTGNADLSPACEIGSTPITIGGFKIRELNGCRRVEIADIQELGSSDLAYMFTVDDHDRAGNILSAPLPTECPPCEPPQINDIEISDFIVLPCATDPLDITLTYTGSTAFHAWTLPGSGSPSLFDEALQLSNAEPGIYHLELTNSCGSTEMELEVEPLPCNPPEITSISVTPPPPCELTPATFNVEATGDCDLSYIWRHEDTGNYLGSGATLTTGFAYQGLKAVLVSNFCGTDTAWVFHGPDTTGIGPCTPPEIFSITHNGPVCEGDTLFLETSWESDGPCTSYQWFPSTHIQPLTDTTAYITAHFSNKIELRVTNGCGQAIMRIPSGNFVLSGTHSEVLCSVEEPFEISSLWSPNPLPSTWLHNGEPHSGIYDPAVDTSGIYMQYHTDLGCLIRQYTLNEHPAVNAGGDTAITVCTNQDPFPLFDLLPGDPMPGGYWTFAIASMNGIFDPLFHGSHLYRYHVSNNYCYDQGTITVTKLYANTWYADPDGDGIGDENDAIFECGPIAGYAPNAGDECPLVYGTIGDECDDGLASTENDMINEFCECIGELITGMVPIDAGGVNIRPNPNSGSFFVDLPSGWQDATVTITDVSGRIVAMERAGSRNVHIHLDRPPGVYLVRVVSRTGSAERRVVVQ